MSDSPRGRPFQTGQSGNPNGRPKGSRNKQTKLLQDFCDEHAIAVWSTIKDRAVQGDPAAMRIWADRTLPPRLKRAIEFECPELNSKEDLPAVRQAIVNACLQGDLTIEDSTKLMMFLQQYDQTLTSSDSQPHENAVGEFPAVASDDGVFLETISENEALRKWKETIGIPSSTEVKQ